ncbi:MAG: protein kinase [Deltaproteobacteria bacterium]|nr:protein kinase [Deltaproteobacteria bacterium]
METFGRFRDLVPLGEGGMGRVFLARAVGPGGFAKPVVLKRMHESLARVPELVERFLDEARLQANLVCPNIVQVLDFGRMGETYFLVLEYVHGIDLGLLLRESKGPLPVGVAVRIALDVCRGLDYAHRARGQTGERLDLVHRDVSPQNVLVSFEGDVKLGDFGLARTGSADDVRPGAIYGKPAYLAPEQARGAAIDARADMFALGTVLYFELTGQSPFRGESRTETLAKVLKAEVRPIEELRPEVSPSLARLVRRAMQADPDQRFPDAAAMLAELEAVALACGKDAGVRAVRDQVQALLPGAAERDPWSGSRARGPVLLELSRLVAEDGITVLTEADREASDLRVARAARAQSSRRRWGILAAAISTVVLVAVAVGMGKATPPSRSDRAERSTAAAADHEGSPRSTRGGTSVGPVDGPAEADADPRTPRAEGGEGSSRPATSPAPAPGAPRSGDAARSADAGRQAPRKAAPRATAGPPTPPPEPAAPPATGRLRVGTTPGWGWVFVDGRRVGTTPLDVVVEAGVRQVKVVGGRTGRERDLPVRVDAGRTGSVFLESFE